MALIGFFDILGTSEAVMHDRFSDIDVLEFVNVIGIAASACKAIRFAVFSDSLIVSTEPANARELIKAINFMYSNWFAELIHVRAAISSGDINWVGHPPTDELFRSVPNLTYARVYGRGLVKAHELEQRSGPGAICFLTQSAAEVFRSKESNSVLEGHTSMLCWLTKDQATIQSRYARSHLARTEEDSTPGRHAAATEHYFANIMRRRRFLPPDYALRT